MNPKPSKRDASLPSVSRYDEIIQSRRNSASDSSVLVRNRGNSLPPPKPELPSSFLGPTPHINLPRRTPSPTPPNFHQRLSI
ncbi:Hypothetical protein FKW44_021121 [Caligus rogercresseyi]|uniref:Uncharacterized protein n=1 Tax=Caligus rogercresseyi TaxID=217165 RepID=A0A7T8GQX9_CALRO|nr:Hypothetical protein FKW44_021121 [Caligus rogercresseyi]